MSGGVVGGGLEEAEELEVEVEEEVELEAALALELGLPAANLVDIGDTVHKSFMKAFIIHHFRNRFIIHL